LAGFNNAVYAQDDDPFLEMGFSFNAEWGSIDVDFLSYAFGVIAPQPGGLPGDFNQDGKVDAADYVTWRKNETANNPLPNDTGVTTQADRYNLWTANFGEMASGGGSAQTAIPEPSSVTLFALAIASGGVAARRRQ
jgi:hypothetical protein